MKSFTSSEKDSGVSIQSLPERAPRPLTVRAPDRSSRTLAVRTDVHAGGPACGYQCLAYRKCLGDNDDWAAIHCDM